MRISIVIPNFNGEKLMRKNLRSVLTVEGAEEVIVVDDGSTDNSASYLKEQIAEIDKDEGRKKLKLIANEENLGFSASVNRGVREAEGEVVVLLNTDVSPEKDFLPSLISHFSDPKVFAVGCLDKSIEDGETILRGRGVGEWRRGFLVHRRGEVDKINTLWVACGSGAFRKNIWEELEGLDVIYDPFYWEDIDLSYRAQKAGYKVLFEPKSIVTHRHEEGAIRQKYSPSKIKTIAYRNQFIFVWKNIDDPRLLLSHIFWLPYHILKSLISFDLAFLSGLFSALLTSPEIWSSRQKSKGLSLRKDREVLAFSS